MYLSIICSLVLCFWTLSKWFHTVCIIPKLAFFSPNMFLRYIHIDTRSSSSFTLIAAWILYSYSIIYWSILLLIFGHSFFFWSRTIFQWISSCLSISWCTCGRASPRDNIFAKCFNTLEESSPPNWTNILIAIVTTMTVLCLGYWE